MPKRQANTANFMEEMEEKFENLITTRKREFSAIPTGSISLDVSLGVGGIPLGRFTEIYGNEGSGKTTLGISIANSAINLGMKVLYCDPEQGLDLARVQDLIGDVAYDTNKFILVQPEYMEEALQVCELAIQSKEFGLIILDSIASMAPKIVKEKDLEDSTMAVVARRLGVFLTRNLYAVNNNNIAFVGINQVRDKFGAFIPTYESPGGHQWKHDCSIRIMLSKLADIKQGPDKVGVMIRFVIKKNKVAPPFRTFTFPIMFDIGVDFYRDLVDFAVIMGVISKSGVHYKFEGNELGSGVNNTITYLKGNKETLDKLTERCYNITNKSVLLEGDEENYEEESES